MIDLVNCNWKLVKKPLILTGTRLLLAPGANLEAVVGYLRVGHVPTQIKTFMARWDRFCILDMGAKSMLVDELLINFRAKIPNCRKTFRVYEPVLSSNSHYSKCLPLP